MEIKTYIGSDILTKFILGLNGNFWAKYNPYFDRIAIYYKEKLITSYQRDYLPRHDVRSDKEGEVVGRGYQHLLQRIWECIKSEEIYVSYEAKKKVIKLLEQLNYFKEPVSYAYHETTQDRDIKKKQEYLRRQYGVEVHTNQEN